MYSCIKAPFLMDGHTTLGWSTCNYSKNHQNYIHFQHLKIIYVFKNMKSFPKRFFFCALEMQLVKHLKGYSQLACVWHAFKRHLLAHHVPLQAGWGGSRHRQSPPGLFTLRLTLCPHISGLSIKLTAQKSCALLLLCRREGHSLLLKFWPLFLASLGAHSCLCREAHPALIILNIQR